MLATALSTPWLSRPAAHEWRCSPPSTVAHAFHASLPGYAATPLVQLPSLAQRWGLGAVVVKDESRRFGLSAFKALGASWALARLLADRTGVEAESLSWDRLRELAAQASLTLVTATDGNHGRALAYFGSSLGLPVEVFVPAVMSPRVEAAIAAEGARLTRIAGNYDDAVAAAAHRAQRLPSAVLVQDTAWEGYEVVPGWIVEGYQTLLAELDDQLRAQHLGAPDLIAVPVGVGSLAQAVISYAHGRIVPSRVLSCEPESAAGVLTSLRAGEPVAVETGATIMAGLNCGRPSQLAWPYLSNGLDAAVAVSDEDAARAVTELAGLGIRAGASGAAALAGAAACLDDPAFRAELDLPESAVVVLLNTEGRVGAGEP